MDRATCRGRAVLLRLFPTQHTACQPTDGITHLGAHGRAGMSIQVAVHWLAASSAMDVRPFPSAVANEQIAGEIRGSDDHILVRGCWVKPEHLLGSLAEAL